MDKSGVEIKGLAELSAALDALPEKLERNVLRTAVRRGAALIAADAKLRAPVDTGALASSIRVSTSARPGVAVRASVRAGGRKAPYVLAVEFGSAAHLIRAPKGEALRLLGMQFVQSVEHPGAAPRPFMRPAFDSKWAASVDAAADYIRARLASIARKGGV